MTSKCKRYCSVPQCKNYKSENISIHFFPKDPLLSKKWAIALRIGKPISKSMSVCSDHFLATDFHPLRLYSTKRYLKIGVVPSQKIPVRKFDQPQPSTSSARMIRTKNRNEKRKCQSAICSTDAEELKEERTATPDFIKDIQQLDGELPAVDETANVEKSMQNNVLEEHDKTIQDNILEERDKSLRFHEHLLSSNGKLSVYTGVHIKLFNTIQKLVINTLKLFPTLNANNIEKKICIILTKLKLNLSFHALSIMYELTTTTVQNYFHDYINVLYFALSPAINFPTKEENFHNLPTCFKEYKEVRIFIDATEVPIQKPSCLDCGTSTYSCFKKTHTSKFLICVNQAGVIVRVRRAYGGCVLDKAICSSEKNIDLLDSYQDGIMVDKSILIEKEFTEKRPFLHNKQLLSKKEALKTASIASARVNVERSIESIKFFKIFANELEWSLVPYLTEMMTIVCALVNLSKPILSDDKST